MMIKENNEDALVTVPDVVVVHKTDAELRAEVGGHVQDAVEVDRGAAGAPGTLFSSAFGHFTHIDRQAAAARGW